MTCAGSVDFLSSSLGGCFEFGQRRHKELLYVFGGLAQLFGEGWQDRHVGAIGMACDTFALVIPDERPFFEIVKCVRERYFLAFGLFGGGTEDFDFAMFILRFKIGGEGR